MGGSPRGGCPPALSYHALRRAWRQRGAASQKRDSCSCARFKGPRRATASFPVTDGLRTGLATSHELPQRCLREGSCRQLATTLVHPLFLTHRILRGMLHLSQRFVCACALVPATLLGVAACGGSTSQGTPAQQAAALVTKGLEAQLAGDLSTAKSDYQQATQLDHTNKFAYYDLG